jgi:hypothetical protein
MSNGIFYYLILFQVVSRTGEYIFIFILKMANRQLSGTENFLSLGSYLFILKSFRYKIMLGF